MQFVDMQCVHSSKVDNGQRTLRYWLSQHSLVSLFVMEWSYDISQFLVACFQTLMNVLFIPMAVLTFAPIQMDLIPVVVELVTG